MTAPITKPMTPTREAGSGEKRETPLSLAWDYYLASGEYQMALYHQRNGDANAAMFQAFAYAFAAGSLRNAVRP